MKKKKKKKKEQNSDDDEFLNKFSGLIIIYI